MHYLPVTVIVLVTETTVCPAHADSERCCSSGFANETSVDVVIR